MKERSAKRGAYHTSMREDVCNTSREVSVLQIGGFLPTSTDEVVHCFPFRGTPTQTLILSVRPRSSSTRLPSSSKPKTDTMCQTTSCAACLRWVNECFAAAPEVVSPRRVLFALDIEVLVCSSVQGCRRHRDLDCCQVCDSPA